MNIASQVMITNAVIASTSRHRPAQMTALPESMLGVLILAFGMAIATLAIFAIEM